jgi:hypothetical protein
VDKLIVDNSTDIYSIYVNVVIYSLDLLFFALLKIR